jgi:hypothetical protein
MEELAMKNPALTVLLSVLVIGGAATILGIYHASNDPERLPGCVVEEPDGGIFVYGAHA